jgi:Nif-specific regulatory protein
VPGVGCRVLREFSLLHEVSAALAQGFELTDTMQPMFRKFTQSTGLHRGLLTVINRGTGELAVAEKEDGGTKTHEVLGKVGEGILGRVASTAEALFVPDLSQLRDPAPSAAEKLVFNESIQAREALVVVPIRHAQEVVGTLSFAKAPGPLAHLENDARFLMLIAGQVGLAVRFRQMAKERIDSLRLENDRLQEQIKRGFIPEGMIGKSSAMRTVYFHVDQVAEGKTTVLIRGETGVGKERIAHAIWQASGRRGRPFVRVNCAALPESIIESELFGHEKGAFTGALALRKGRFELAHTGTIFLDEIGEISPATQAKLLRVLQEGTFERVGGHETLRVDVRVIAATNRNLEQMIEEGKYRQDLYYRINVFPIYVPPLRERRSDVLELADHFLEKYSRQNGKRIVRLSTPAIDMLMAYHWPGNVRELENVIERAVLLSEDSVIHGFHMPPTLQTAEASGTVQKSTLAEAVEAVEREMIVEALKNQRGIMAKAARQLGLTERMMGLRVRKLGIEAERYKGPEE